MSSCYLFVCVACKKKGGRRCEGYREEREGQPWPAPVVVVRGASVACSSLCLQCAKLAGPDRAPGCPPVCVSLVGGAGSRGCLLWCTVLHMSSRFTHSPISLGFVHFFSVLIFFPAAFNVLLFLLLIIALLFLFRDVSLEATMASTFSGAPTLAFQERVL